VQLSLLLAGLCESASARPVPQNLGNGLDNSYTLVYSFDRPVASAGNASVTQGAANIATGSDTATASIGTNPNEVRVELTGVTNAQHLIVTLSGVQDTSGNTFADVPARMDLLFGDVNATGRTDSGDVTAVRQSTISIPDQTNFRYDVDTSGRIDAGDVTLTRQASITTLP